MGSIKRVLSDVCFDIGKGQHTPNKKWIRDVLTGMIASRSTMTTEIARHVRDDAKIQHRVKRLYRGLNSDRLDDQALQTAHLGQVARFTKKDDGRGVVLGVDYTDLSKPYARPTRARGMPSCQCRDGSKGEVGTGIPVVQVEASLPDGNQLPVLLRPFLHNATAKHSQNLEFLDGIGKVAPHVGSFAWWTFDRGFDGAVMMNGLDKLALRWIIRLQCNVKFERDLFMADGRKLKVNDAALETIPRYKLDIKNGRKKAKGTGKKTTTLEIGYRKVYLSDMRHNPAATGKARTLIVVWGFGRDPLVTLASEELTGRAAIIEAVQAYGRRWKAEESTRSAKDSRGWGIRLEDIRALTLRGIRRLVLLGTVAYLVIALLRDAGGDLLEKLIAAADALGKVPADPRYRVMRGAGENLRSDYPKSAVARFKAKIS